MEDLSEYISDTSDTSQLLENASDISQLLENASDTSELFEHTFDTSQVGETIKKRKVGKTSLQRIVVNKGGRPRAAVWDDFITGKSDGKGHYGAKCCYCTKGNWKRGRPAKMEAHLALHCKGEVPENIRQRWLVEVAKRNDKATNNDSDNDTERLLDEEAAHVTVRVDNLLDKAQKLTLGKRSKLKKIG
ncbi:12917_t:CDS:2, partial [Racocetra fulgida]